ncbi:MAG: hypothetical protein ACREEE_02765 [Dongiaceae bacterium]
MSNSSTLSRMSTVLLLSAGAFAIVTFLFEDLAYDVAISAGFSEATSETHEGSARSRWWSYWRSPWSDWRPAGAVSACPAARAGRWRWSALPVLLWSQAPPISAVSWVYQLGVNVAALKP